MQLPTNPDDPDSQLYVITLNTLTGLKCSFLKLLLWHLESRLKTKAFIQIIMHKLYRCTVLCCPNLSTLFFNVEVG